MQSKHIPHSALNTAHLPKSNIPTNTCNRCSKTTCRAGKLRFWQKMCAATMAEKQCLSLHGLGIIHDPLDHAHDTTWSNVLLVILAAWSGGRPAGSCWSSAAAFFLQNPFRMLRGCLQQLLENTLVCHCLLEILVFLLAVFNGTNHLHLHLSNFWLQDWRRTSSAPASPQLPTSRCVKLGWWRLHRELEIVNFGNEILPAREVATDSSRTPRHRKSLCLISSSSGGPHCHEWASKPPQRGARTMKTQFQSPSQLDWSQHQKSHHKHLSSISAQLDT